MILGAPKRIQDQLLLLQPFLLLRNDRVAQRNSKAFTGLVGFQK